MQVYGQALSVAVSGGSLEIDRAVKLINRGRLSPCGAGADTTS